MDDNYVINRIIDILHSGNGLLLGNISSPQPGKVCSVNTSSGVKSAYNINCTYPGDAIVVWDKDEEQYYCFTAKPNTVLNNRQLVYRKYKQSNTEKAIGGYVLLLDSNFFRVVQDPVNDDNTLVFLESVLKKLNPNYKTIYTGIADSNNKFFGTLINKLGSNYFAFTYDYKKLQTYLEAKGKKIVEVKDTEMDKVNDIFWMPLFDQPPGYTTPDITLIKTLKKLAKNYGVVLQSDWGGLDTNTGIDNPGGWKETTNYYLNNFYNPHYDPITNLYVYEVAIPYNNIPPNKDKLFNSAATGVIDVPDSVREENKLSYAINYGNPAKTIIKNPKRVSTLYWKPSNFD